MVRDPNQPDNLETEGTQNVTNLNRHFDTGLYLTPHSDIVALMTLEHQTRMTNLITRVGYEARMAMHDNMTLNRELGRPKDEVSESVTRRINSAAEELVEYMLFGEEALLTDPLQGTSAFAKTFGQGALRDSHGRSLRDFDLRTRLMRYPCSYLIYSEAFGELPPVAKDRVYLRLWEVLSERDVNPKFVHLTKKDRKAILEILLATKKDLPKYWRE